MAPLELTRQFSCTFVVLCLSTRADSQLVTLQVTFSSSMQSKSLPETSVLTVHQRCKTEFSKWNFTIIYQRKSRSHHIFTEDTFRRRKDRLGTRTSWHSWYWSRFLQPSLSWADSKRSFRLQDIKIMVHIKGVITSMLFWRTATLNPVLLGWLVTLGKVQHTG